jgi:phosphoadenosine phosphosulfate reductase
MDWCKNCRRETAKDKCELCGATTEREIPLEVYWCPNCKVPLIKYANAIDRDVCPACGGDAELGVIIFNRYIQNPLLGVKLC